MHHDRTECTGSQGERCKDEPTALSAGALDPDLFLIFQPGAVSLRRLC
jgi:hypothetical protein